MGRNIWKNKKISKEEEQEYSKIVERGFLRNSKEDPYGGLFKTIIEAINRSCYINGRFVTEHYVAKYQEKIVGTKHYEKLLIYDIN